jgi:hypothetical protein
MLDFIFALCNVVATFILFYYLASLAVIGVAELIQLAILGREKFSEGLQEGELQRFLLPPLVTGTWLVIARWMGWGML